MSETPESLSTEQDMSSLFRQNFAMKQLYKSRTAFRLNSGQALIDCMVKLLLIAWSSSY